MRRRGLTDYEAETDKQDRQGKNYNPFHLQFL